MIYLLKAKSIISFRAVELHKIGLVYSYRLSCLLHEGKQDKPHIFIFNKYMSLLLSGIRPFIPLFNSKLSMRSVSFYLPALQYMQKVRGVHTGPEPENPNLTPRLSFANADVQKSQILKEVKGKAGVYR